MTSLLIFPENMEVPWGGRTQLTTGSDILRYRKIEEIEL
jgi:hypothetical protein